MSEEGGASCPKRAVDFADTTAENVTPGFSGVKSIDGRPAEIFASRTRSILRDLEITQGLLRDGAAVTSPPVASLLRSAPGRWFTRSTPDGIEVTLVRRVVPRPRERWWLHLLLLVATLFTTTAAGAYLAGGEPFDYRTVGIASWRLPVPTELRPAELLPGLWFSLPFLGILLAHELGHYLVALRRGMDVSPPFFLPGPHQINLIGTFGAFIRLRSPIVNRAVLLDVGAAGPLVSFVLSVAATVVGLRMSLPVHFSGAASPSRWFVVVQRAPLFLGESLTFRLLSDLALPAAGFPAYLLHPLAIAGWLGLFFTAMNLLPVSQLDGGHVLYALFGARQKYISIWFLLLLLFLGLQWQGWWLWAALILVIGRGRVDHPHVVDPDFPIVRTRRWIAWSCVVILLVTFVPIPFL